jgi:hypothetical protein
MCSFPSSSSLVATRPSLSLGLTFYKDHAHPHALPGLAAPARGAVDGGRGGGRGRRGPARNGERNYNQGQGDYQGQQNRDGRPPAAPRAPPVPVPKEDFDFEEGLLKFDKGQVKNVSTLLHWFVAASIPHRAANRLVVFRP